ncbi:MAG: hypothetical protein AABX16_01920 [Nanoarchaeota archaeon]
MVKKKKVRASVKKIILKNILRIFLFVVCSFILVVTADILFERLEILKAPPYPTPVPPLQLDMPTTPTVTDIGKSCSTNADCGSCTSICVRGHCYPSGMYLCPDGTAGAGNCVFGPGGDCKCAEECDPCTEYCSIAAQGYTCFPTGRVKCDSGICVSDAKFCTKEYNYNSNCDSACVDSCDKCRNHRIEGTSEYTYTCVKDYLTKTLCDGGFCVPKGDNCPESCSPGCKPCIETCSIDSDGKSRCLYSGDKICPTGACVDRDFDCDKLEMPIIETTPPLTETPRTLSDIFKNFPWPW